MKKKIFYWEISGMIFITLVGSFLHFLFQISGYFLPVGAISAVNESVWEHLKLGYWPLVFFGVIEYIYIRKETKNFFFAKLISALLIMVLIIVFFYGYTAILGEDNLFLDISIFVLSIVIAQLVSYKILTIPDFSKTLSYASIAGIVILGILFIIFTYFPPHFFLFQDSLTGMYGIS
ncbi:MAG: DUF6512 family protein [Candidatus Lokiarchaeota archaeon]